MPVPSKMTRDGSFWDLNRKYTDEDMIEDVTGGEYVEMEGVPKDRTQRAIVKSKQYLNEAITVKKMRRFC